MRGNPQRAVWHDMATRGVGATQWGPVCHIAVWGDEGTGGGPTCGVLGAPSHWHHEGQVPSTAFLSRQHSKQASHVHLLIAAWQKQYPPVVGLRLGPSHVTEEGAGSWHR
jgi:hypothetical protein